MSSPFRPDFLAHYSAARKVDDVVALQKPRVPKLLLALAALAALLAYVLFGFSYPRRVNLPASIVSSLPDGSAVARVEKAMPSLDESNAYWLRSGTRAVPCAIVAKNGSDVRIRAIDGRPLAPGIGWLRVSRGSRPIVSLHF